MVVEGQARNGADGVKVVRGASMRIMVFWLQQNYARIKLT